MDRLVIESILADVNEIYLSERSESHPSPAIVMGFKASNTDQVISAFHALKQIAAKNDVELVICKTMTSGMYDIEIKTNALDEPIRISNKVIDHETLGGIEDQMQLNTDIVLGTNVSEEENWIRVHSTHVKDCEVDL